VTAGDEPRERVELPGNGLVALDAASAEFAEIVVLFRHFVSSLSRRRTLTGPHRPAFQGE
jgi:H2-forming N5,N10-methylenetetrahydromethanopterin dehydrogenase-like enzyme